MGQELGKDKEKKKEGISLKEKFVMSPLGLELRSRLSHLHPYSGKLKL